MKNKNVEKYFLTLLCKGYKVGSNKARIVLDLENVESSTKLDGGITMAKSIFEILDDLTTETSVPVVGKNVEHSLPRKLFPTSEIFESPEKLLSWSNENGFTHALLQMGLQKGLIDLRATFKSVKKDETWTEENGQKKVNESKWETVSRPKSGNTVEKAIDTLSKLSPEQLAAILAQLQAGK